MASSTLEALGMIECKGFVALVEASPAAYRELGKIPVFTGRTWNNPALADGKAYLRSDQEMACYDLTGR